MTNLISPSELYPEGAGAPLFRLLDVRAPIEVARGALPYSLNLPIMTDEERHLVGIRYKEAGQAAAVTLGYELVTPDLPRRIEAWRAACAEESSAVMCWRGGMRSELTTKFIDLPDVPRVQGGYKALRNHLLERFDSLVASRSFYVVAGLTGSGKTALLKRVQEGVPEVLALDLEAAAKHRGSAFGATLEPQPPQATFENELALTLLLNPQRVVLIEDESRQIGHCAVPESLFEHMQTSPLILIEEPLESRVKQLFEDYVLELTQALGVTGAREVLTGNLGRIRQRLSRETLERILRHLNEAERLGLWYELEAHAGWLGALLESYYDPLYLRGLRKSARTVAYRGTKEACLRWIETLHSR